MHTYTSSKFKVFLSVFSFSFLSFIVCMIVFGIFDSFDGLEDRWSLVIIGSVLMGVLISIFNYIKIEVDKETIKFYRLGKCYRTIAMSTSVITTYVVRHYYNGIPSGTSLHIRAQDETMENPKDYLCKNFSKKTFQTMFAKIYALRPHDMEAETEENVPFVGEKRFDIPRDDFIVKEYKRQTKILIIGLLISVFFVAPVGIILYNSASDSVNDFTFFIFALSIVVMCVVIPYIFLKVRISKMLKVVPTLIVVSEECIQIDNDVFQVEKMEGIRITPLGYQNSMSNGQRILNFNYQGKSYNFSFGYMRANLPMYNDYPKLCSMLEKIFRKYDVFIFEL